MSNKILVTYATRLGSTAGVAEEIGKILTESGASIERSTQSKSCYVRWHSVCRYPANRGGLAQLILFSYKIFLAVQNSIYLYGCQAAYKFIKINQVSHFRHHNLSCPLRALSELHAEQPISQVSSFSPQSAAR